MIIKIDGKECSCEKGEYILDIARRNKIVIPTLCHHPALAEGQGACRLCIVEITLKGRKSIVVSCVYPVVTEIEVETNSERVRKERGLILTLLQKRAPDSERIKALCKMYNAPQIDRFATLDNEKCVMCGLCAKICHELGAGAISTVNRGITKAVSTPYGDPSESCIGCLSCANVCPTKAISFEEDNDKRVIWGKTFEIVHCERCGEAIGTREQIEEVAKRTGNEFEGLCDNCLKERMARVMANTYGYDVE